MLNLKVESNTTTCTASGTHRHMLAEALVLETQLHRFVYRLGLAEYAVFLMEMAKITHSDDFMDFLKSDPDEETHIRMPNFNRKMKTDG